MRIKDPSKIEAIFKAALKLVMQEGLAGLKITALAKEAGLATGTMYLYFTDKEDLINQLYLHLRRSLAEAHVQGYQSDLPFPIGFKIIWNNYLDSAISAPEAYAFIEQYHRSPYIREEIKREADKFHQPIFELIEKGKIRGQVIKAPTEMLVAQLSGALHELARRHVVGALPLDTLNRRMAFDMALKSIAP